MEKRRMLWGAVGAAISAAAIREGISMVLDRSMVMEALNRHEPRTMYGMKSRIKGCEEELAALECLKAAADCLTAIPHEVVSMHSYDGIQLLGHLFRVEQTKRVILAMHGWRSSWARDFGMAAEFFVDNHCTVLYVEQRGQGSSGGKYMGFGMIERFDCLEWIKWLNQHGFDSMPIYLAGISMGAATVLMTAGFHELPENVTGILADCGFTSAREEWQHISENNLHRPYTRRCRHVDYLCRRRIAMNSDAYSTLDAMQVCKVPVLFVHGSADHFVPVDMTLQNYAACKAPKKMLIVEGASHGMSYMVAPERYQKTVQEFWRMCETQ